jgi:hypothetical protein
MKTSIHVLLVVAVSGFCLGVAAEPPPVRSVLAALPPAESLGPGWKRDIDALFDSASQPPEIIGASARIPDSFKQQQRLNMANPTNNVSGWGHLDYEFQGTNRHRRYEVNIERFRSKDRLYEEFNRLLTLESDQYQKTELKTVGESAVIYQHATGVSGLTLWFCRGNFRVWIAPMDSTASWKGDAEFQKLARALDDQMRNEAGPDAVKTKPDAAPKE